MKKFKGQEIDVVLFKRLNLINLNKNNILYNIIKEINLSNLNNKLI